MESSRNQAIYDEINKKKDGGNVNWNYVDKVKLARLGINQYITKKGTNFIRIVTSKSAGLFGVNIFKHSKIGVDNKTFICTEKMYKKPCPVCELYKDIEKKFGRKDERLKALYSARRYLYYVVDVTDEKTMSEGVKWFDCPASIRDDMFALSYEPKNPKNVIDVSDPVHGRDIRFIRNDRETTDYNGVVLIESSPIPESWYTDLPDYDSILIVPTYDEVKEAVTGMFTDSIDYRRDMGVREEIVDTGNVRPAAVRGVINIREEIPKDEVKEEIIDDAPAKVKSNVREEASNNTRNTIRGSFVRQDANKEEPVYSGSEDVVKARLAEIQAKRNANQAKG
jgi:hypothetical protein